jgi:hypothetical protein
MNFEQRWKECFEGVKQANDKKFGEFGAIMSTGFAEFKPMFELFYEQAQEDLLNKLGEKKVV